jgi:hypothetical protein
MTIHGMAGSPTHRVWSRIVFGRYNFCERWRDFENFLADMGPIPGSGYTLSLINVSKPFSKENCVWSFQWGKK